MTKKELSERLTELGIEHDASVKKAELELLLAEHSEEEDESQEVVEESVVKEEPETEEAAEETAVEEAPEETQEEPSEPEAPKGHLLIRNAKIDGTFYQKGDYVELSPEAEKEVRESGVI